MIWPPTQPPRKCPHGQWYCQWSKRSQPCAAPKNPNDCSTWWKAADALLRCGIPALVPPRVLPKGQLELPL